MEGRQLPVFFSNKSSALEPGIEWFRGEVVPHSDQSARAQEIMRWLKEHKDLFALHSSEDCPVDTLRQVHSAGLIDVIASSESIAQDERHFPFCFSPSDILNSTYQHTPPLKQQRLREAFEKYSWQQAGLFAYDTVTPLMRESWSAAIGSAGAAYGAAKSVLAGEPVAYALCRPSGHHAMRHYYGGYCYFNNAAIVAETAKRSGKRVAIVDIDFHHGNGTQDIFYSDPNVLVVNVHGDPKTVFPFYWGFSHEHGQGEGEGYNVNIPLSPDTDGDTFVAVVRDRVLEAIKEFAPDFLVISAGFDTAETDPLGEMSLNCEHYSALATAFRGLDYPTVIVQEGGYDVEALGRYVISFLKPWV